MRAAAGAVAWVARLVAVAVVVVLVAPAVWRLATGDRFLDVTGVSMMPTYHLDDVLVVRAPTGDELTRVGQVVVATFGDSVEDGPFYVHRVWELTEDGAFLKGDANDGPDPRPITADQVVGTPRAHLVGPVAHAYLFTQTLVGRLVLVAIALGAGVGVPALRDRLLPAGRRRRGRHDDPVPPTPAADLGGGTHAERRA